MRSEVLIWIGINLMLARSFGFINISLHGTVWSLPLSIGFSTTLIALNIYRLYAARHLRMLYGLALVFNHLALYVTGDYTFIGSIINLIRLIT